MNINFKAMIIAFTLLIIVISSLIKLEDKEIPARGISSKQAQELLGKLIKITSDKLPSLGLEVSVGQSCDCAILNPKKGVKWLNKISSNR